MLFRCHHAGDGCFVRAKVEDAESAYQCLGLHHSRLDGRLLNVERTSGGGKVSEGGLITLFHLHMRF